MSVRAHRVNKIEYKKDHTLNLWNDEKALEVLAQYGIYFNEGETYIDDMDNLTEAVNAMKEQGVEDYIIKAFEEDIAWAKECNQNCLTYHCY